jgi:hypothetical protein
MRKARTIAVSLLSLICFLAAVPAWADPTVLYTTLGPGGSFGTYAYAVDGSSYSNEVIANSFSLNSAAVVSDAQLAIYFALGENNPASVYIESDSGGSPGSILDSLIQVGAIQPYGVGNGLVTYDCSGAGCNLASGTYWLVAAETNADTLLGWYFNYAGTTTNQAFDSTGSPTGPWNFDSVTETAFEIDGPVIPEPSSFLLFSSGLLGLASLIRRKLRV